MRVGPIDLVIAGWPCQGHTRVSRGEGLHDPQSCMFAGVMPFSDSSSTCFHVHFGECTFVG
jgi:hypothetical protein